MERDVKDYVVELVRIMERDDPDALLKLFQEYPDAIASGVVCSASRQAKKCLTMLVSGKVCETPLALDDRSIHFVAWHFPDPEVINILFERGAKKHVNIEYCVGPGFGTPLQLVLGALSFFMRSWSPGDSIFKLVILLCQWEAKHRIDAARLFASETDSVREIAETFLKNGKLMELAALLLVAREKVMVPNESGITLQQDVTKKIDDLNHEQAEYKSFLLDACKLFDVFESAGNALSLYCRSMKKQVSRMKVLDDVVGILKEAGFVLQLVDIDLRDCYRGCHELWKPDLYKLSDAPRQNDKFSLSYPAEIQRTLPSRHWDPLLARLKSGKVISLASSSPHSRWLSTTAGQFDRTVAGSSVAVLKHFAYAAIQLKRGILR